jgi:AlwI restriction endonuclease
LLQIVSLINIDIKNLQTGLGVQVEEIKGLEQYSEDDLKKLIVTLRDSRRLLQEKENHKISQGIEKVGEYISKLENIYQEEDRPLSLEKYTSLSLHALNDAINIHPNYPVGDDNEPTFTAPAGKPDIECYYESFNSICEVTMLTGRDQWYNEGQPVMRHLRDFETKNINKKAYCLFIAPTLHRDTMSTFWFSVKYEYEGKQQKIIPLTIKDFIEVLKTLSYLKENNSFLKHSDLENLYEGVINKSKEFSNVSDWINSIPAVINNWKQTLSA